MYLTGVQGRKLKLVTLFSAVRRLPATIIVCLTIFSIGLGSAIDVNVLVNQDTVWGFATIIAGCFLVFLALRYGVLKFRQELYNQVRVISGCSM